MSIEEKKFKLGENVDEQNVEGRMGRGIADTTKYQNWVTINWEFAILACKGHGLVMNRSLLNLMRCVKEI